MRKLLALPLLALALTGCSSGPETAQLNVRKVASDDVYTTAFDRALFTESDGRTDVLLLGGQPGEGDLAAVQQAVHLKVLWSPTRTIRLDSPSAGNAMIDWTLTGAGDDRVSYTGSCWARVRVDGDEASVDLREANVSVRQVSGTMADPLKHAKLDGQFTAKRADALVRAYLSEHKDGQRDTTTAALPQTPRTNTP